VTGALRQDVPVGTGADLPMTRKLLGLLHDASENANRHGRESIEAGDLRQALALPSRRRRRRRHIGVERLDGGALEWWRAAQHAAALAGHPYLAPEHLRLVGADEAERTVVLGRLGAFGGSSFWRPRGPRSAARRRGRAKTAERRRMARADSDRAT
jgi:hypothetical protein